MIDKDQHVEIAGTITDTTVGQFTVVLEEIFVDGQWRTFSPEKKIDILNSDYDTSLTPQELELVRLLAEKSKDNKGMSPDQVTLAESIVAKLGASHVA